jgi:hypothetical protein
LAFTVAEGTGVPDASLTIPVMLADTWARAGIKHANAGSAKQISRNRTRLIALERY